MVTNRLNNAPAVLRVLPAESGRTVFSAGRKMTGIIRNARHITSAPSRPVSAGSRGLVTSSLPRRRPRKPGTIHALAIACFVDGLYDRDPISFEISQQGGKGRFEAFAEQKVHAECQGVRRAARRTTQWRQTCCRRRRVPESPPLSIATQTPGAKSSRTVPWPKARKINRLARCGHDLMQRQTAMRAQHAMRSRREPGSRRGSI